MIKCKSKKVNNVKEVLESHKNKNESEKKKVSGREKLDDLIGIEEVKKQVYKVVNYIRNSKNRNKMPMLHMCFTGNPGTGKTTVARVVGEIFKEEKILSTGNFVEAQRGDLIAEYIGQTAPKTLKKIGEAKGGVLFIDEAYNLSYSDSSKDYGHECVATLIKEMEDKRDDLCVILAGYSKEMEQLLNTNPGFKSRIQFNIEFPDYNEEELYEIFKIMCKEEGYKITPNVKNMLIKHFEITKKEENFSNGRYVRNIFEKIKMEQASRVIEDKSDPNLIKKVDIEDILNKELLKQETKNKIKIGFTK
jgi:AAA+ superfamily predicted ATPase